MFLIKTWNCQLSSPSTGLRILSSVESAEQIQRGKQNRRSLPAPSICSLPKAFILQEGTEYGRTIPNLCSRFMCAEGVGNLDFQPLAQSQQMVRNKKVSRRSQNISDNYIILKPVSLYVNVLRTETLLFVCLHCKAQNIC